MYKVFVEYKIKPECLDRYLAWAERLSQRDKRVSVYEGSDQPGLFVEDWQGVAPGEFPAMKRRRKGVQGVPVEACDSDAAELLEFVEGGADKIHIWHFCKVK